MTEKRKHPRAPAIQKVRYTSLNEFLSAYINNVSMGGIFVTTENPLPLNTEFHIQLTAPSLESELEVRGRVQWIRNTTMARKMGQPPGMGVQFVFKSAREKADLEYRIEKLMIDSLGYPLYKKLMEGL